MLAASMYFTNSQQPMEAMHSPLEIIVDERRIEGIVDWKCEIGEDIPEQEVTSYKNKIYSPPKGDNYYFDDSEVNDNYFESYVPKLL